MRAQVVLLCEDEQSACFARRFLKRRGFSAYELREVISPTGKGSGEQFVRERFPDELRAYRDAKNTALIAITDADTMTVQDRIGTLEKQCRENQVAVRRPDEAVLMMIPGRNIETWLAYLRATEVNETDAYPKYAAESDCRDQVIALDEMCRAGELRQPAPPSLEAACEEWKRFPR